MPRLDLAACGFDGDPFPISDFPGELQIRRRADGDNFAGNAASFRATDLFELPAFRFRQRRERRGACRRLSQALLSADAHRDPGQAAARR